jgi:hypothetical protein
MEMGPEKMNKHEFMHSRETEECCIMNNEGELGEACKSVHDYMKGGWENERCNFHTST